MALHKYLALSFAAFLRTDSLQISLPQNFANALIVEELNRVSFNGGSGGVFVCLLFFQIAKNMKILVILVLSH